MENVFIKNMFNLPDHCECMITFSNYGNFTSKEISSVEEALDN